MPQQTDAELLIEAGVIKDETQPETNTAIRVGEMYENIIDSKVNNSRMDYKIYAATLSYNGSFTLSEKSKEITGTVTPSLVGNGQVYLTSSTNQWTDSKTVMIGSTMLAGAAYFVFGVPLSTSIFALYIVLHDGTQSSTPNFTDFYFEIKVYN